LIGLDERLDQPKRSFVQVNLALMIFGLDVDVGRGLLGNLVFLQQDGFLSAQAELVHQVNDRLELWIAIPLDNCCNGPELFWSEAKWLLLEALLTMVDKVFVIGQEWVG